MLRLLRLVRRTLEGSLLAILIIALAAFSGVSETINLAFAEPSFASLFFVLIMAVVLADLIGKALSILSSTFPDLLPAVDEEDLKRASLIQRLRPGQTVALMSGAHAARLALFLCIFALLGTSYAFAPRAVQETLFGPMATPDAILRFIREGLAGSLGYFLFFLGPDHLKPIIRAITDVPLEPTSFSGDAFLAGIRIYGLAFVLAILRTLATPITFWRARRRADRLPTPPEATEPAPDEA